MPVALGDHGGSVAPLKCRQDGPVLVVQVTLPGWEYPSGAVGLGAVPHVRDQPHEPGHGAGSEESGVEPVTVRAVPVGITLRQRPEGCVERRGGCGPVRVGFKFEGDTKVRVCRKCGQTLETKK